MCRRCSAPARRVESLGSFLPSHHDVTRQRLVAQTVGAMRQRPRAVLRPRTLRDEGLALARAVRVLAGDPQSRNDEGYRYKGQGPGAGSARQLRLRPSVMIGIVRQQRDLVFRRKPLGSMPQARAAQARNARAGSNGPQRARPRSGRAPVREAGTERGTPFSGWSKTHPVFPAGGCITCAAPSRQGCSASACASKSPISRC